MVCLFLLQMTKRSDEAPRHKANGPEWDESDSEARISRVKEDSTKQETSGKENAGCNQTDRCETKAARF